MVISWFSSPLCYAKVKNLQYSIIFGNLILDVTLLVLCQVKPPNLQHLMMDAALLLPLTGTPLTGIEFYKRLPCGEVEHTRRVSPMCLGSSLFSWLESRLPEFMNLRLHERLLNNVTRHATFDLPASPIFWLESKQMFGKLMSIPIPGRNSLPA